MIDLTGSPPNVKEVLLGSANVFVGVNLPPQRKNLVFSLYATEESYYCYEGTDGGTRDDQPRVMIPKGQWIELDQMVGEALYFASANAPCRVHVAWAYPHAVGD